MADERFAGLSKTVFIFKATQKQILEMAAVATANSRPMGLGFLHFNSTDVFSAGDFEILRTGKQLGLDLDYINGRMVKLHIWEDEEALGSDQWFMHDGQMDYQSWITKVSVSQLIGGCGGTIVREIAPSVEKGG